MQSVIAEPFKSKFMVLDTSTRKPVPDAFIMFPNADPLALPALKAYFAGIKGDDPDRQALSDWIDKLESIRIETSHMEKYE